MIQDAVSIFAKAFGDNVTFIEQFRMAPAECYNTYEVEEPSASGRDVLDKLDQVEQ